MTIAAHVIPEDALAVSEDVVRLKVGLPWYRSLPWAGVDEISLELDGQPLGEALLIDGTTPDRLGDRADYWSIQRWAEVEFANPRHVRAGTTTSARVRVSLRIPGPLLPDGSPMPSVFERTQQVSVGHLDMTGERTLR